MDTVVTPNKFKQHDNLRGRINEISEFNGSYYLVINFINGTKIRAKSSKEISLKLNMYLGEETLIDFSGEATYCFVDDFDLKLVDFHIDNFEVVEDITVDKWVDEFIAYGRSGWLDIEDPYHLLKVERCS